MANVNMSPFSSQTPMDMPAAYAGASERSAFIQRTYLHLAAAIGVLVLLEVALFTLVPKEAMVNLVRSVSPMMWLVVLGIFIGVNWLANYWAVNGASPALQYAGLGLYTFCEALLLFPMLFVAVVYVDPNIPISAAIITLLCFGGLTGFMFVTKADLTSWGRYLCLAGFAAMGVIVVGMFTGFSLGIWFSGAMIALACGYILYDTSNVIHNYRTDQHVAASLALLSSVVLLFWYVLRILMQFAALGDD